jgi:hypothetical protein
MIWPLQQRRRSRHMLFSLRTGCCSNSVHARVCPSHTHTRLCVGQIDCTHVMCCRGKKHERREWLFTRRSTTSMFQPCWYSFAFCAYFILFPVLVFRRRVLIEDAPCVQCPSSITHLSRHVSRPSHHRHGPDTDRHTCV